MTDPEDRVPQALEALRALHGLALRTPALREDRSEDDERFLARLERLLEMLGTRAQGYEFEGRDLLATAQLRYPDLWAALDRRLLWFFGGECLHFLDDDEIAAFQREEDARD